MKMITNLCQAIKRVFNNSSFTDYWETDKYGAIPAFPVIYYDKSIPHDFFLYCQVKRFYNEFIGDQLTAHEIIIDRKGRVFELKYHSEKFKYPALTKQIMDPQELKHLLVRSEIEGLEKYLVVDSVEEIMLLLEKNRAEHKK